MATIPSKEPQSVTAGDTIQWLRTLPDYPASAGWTLNYRLINATGHIDITGQASGSDHLISIPSSVVPAWVAGTYDWQAYVTAISGERHTIGIGRMVVLPNLSTQVAGFDARSQARQILEGLYAAYLDAVKNRAFVAEYGIANRRFKFATRQEWIVEINFWKIQVTREDQANAIKNSNGSGRKTLVRF